MRFWVVFICCVIAFGARAGEIAATVNDRPISTFDVEARLKLLQLQQADLFSSLSETQKKKKVLQMLIDEEIKRQVAQKEGLNMTQAELEDAIRHLENQNALSPGALKEKLSEHKIPWETLANQIEADLLWLQILQKNKPEQGNISDQMIQEKQNEIRRSLKEKAFLISEIVVPDEETAYHVYELLETVPFEELVQKYSVGAAKKQDGITGWIHSNHYGEEAAQILEQMERGQISRPIPFSGGFLIAAMHDKRMPIESDTIQVWEMAQMALSTEKSAQYERQIEHISSCTDFLDFAKTQAIPESIQHGMLSPMQMPEELYELLKNEKVNIPIGPIHTPGGYMYFMKCLETEQRIVPTLEQIKTQLENEQIILLSERLLDSFKRYAVIVYK